MLYLIVTTVFYAAPVILLVLIFRRRLYPWAASSLLALASTGATGFTLWRMEWFDVWRQGVPPVTFILTAYGPKLAVFAVLGWFAGSLIARRGAHAGPGR